MRVQTLPTHELHEVHSARLHLQPKDKLIRFDLVNNGTTQAQKQRHSNKCVRFGKETKEDDKITANIDTARFMRTWTNADKKRRVLLRTFLRDEETNRSCVAATLYVV